METTFTKISKVSLIVLKEFWLLLTEHKIILE